MIYDQSSIHKKRLKLRSKKQRILSAISVRIFQAVLLCCLFLFVGGTGLFFGSIEGMISSVPEIQSLEPEDAASFILDSDENVTQKLNSYDSNRIKLEEDDITDLLANAFVSIEDERFYSHNGVDLKGIIRAAVTDLTKQSTSQGASTITQQLIKNKAFNVGGETNPLAKVKRKVQEMYLALQEETKYTKKEIICDYLNTINLGKGTLGVQTAALYYFNKDAKDLNAAECAVLAAITKNPTNLNPVDYPEANKERQELVLKKMYELNHISLEEYKEAMNYDVYAEIEETTKNKKTSVYSYFTDAVITQVVEDLQTKLGYTQSQAYTLIYKGGLKIYSTQDSELQKIANSVINDKSNYPVDTDYSLEYQLNVKHSDGSSDDYTEVDVRDYFRKKKDDSSYTTVYDTKKKMKKAAASFKKHVVKDGDTVESEVIHYSLEPQLSFSLIDQATGQVKVLVGGRGTKYDDLALNRATSVTRQPGSTFKIVSTYAPAIDSGDITLATVYDDAPYKYEDGKSVQNAEKNYLGLTSIREAIEKSDNIVAVKAITDLTPRVAYNYLETLGFTTLVNNRTTSDGDVESDITQSLALGGITDGVTNLQLTAAYASIANKGVYQDPILYTKVVDSEGNIILENKSEGKQVMKESTAWLLTDAMEDVIEKGTGTEAKLSSKMAVAGKTGTTSNNYDYWFCGYTPYYTASIWTGYDLNTSFDNDSGYHKVIWAKIMDKIIDAKDQKIKTKFDSCDDIVKAKVCTLSGKLPQEGVCSKDPEKNMVHTEYFAKDTVPEEECDCHIKLTLCKTSKRIASSYCPKESTYTKIYRVRPEGSKGTTDDTKYCFGHNTQTYICNKHTKKWKEEQDAKAATATTAAKDATGATGKNGASSKGSDSGGGGSGDSLNNLGDKIKNLFQ